ncbi:MAG: hypothetical protein ACUVRU_03080 [Anaerolineae bacterium]
MSAFTTSAGALVLSSAPQSDDSASLPVALIALLIVAVIYAVIVVAEIALASQARKQRNQWREKRQQALDRLVNARSRLTELSTIIGSGQHGEPYKSLHEQARQLTEKGLGAIDSLLQRIEQNALREIRDQPALKALLLIPLAVEIRQHRRQQREMDAILNDVAPATEVVAQVEALKDEIATLGQREKSFAAQLRQKALGLADILQAETRSALLLEDERHTLARANQSLGKIEHLLQAEQPDETDVVAAFSLRAYVEHDLQRLAESLEKTVEARTATEQGLRDAETRLVALRQDIAEDVAAGCQRDRLSEQAEKLAGQLNSLKMAFEQGRYAELSNDISALMAALQAEQETIRQLHAARERIAAARDGAMLQMENLRVVIRDTPARFDRDVTRKLTQQIEDAIASLEALLPSEDLGAMAGVQSIEQQIETWLKEAAQAQQAFDANRQTFEQRVATLNDNAINTSIAAAKQAADMLRARHPDYWVGAAPDELQAASAELGRNWRALTTELETIAESAFATALNKLALVQQQRNALDALVANAAQIETQAQEDERRARSLIDDPELLRQLEEFEMVAPHSDDLAPRAGEFAGTYQQLRQQAQEPIPYWAEIVSRATRMRDELASALNEYRQQLAQAISNLTRLKSRLEQMREALKSLSNDPALDFESSARAPLQAIEEWLTAQAGVDARFLREVQATVERGEAVRLEAQQRISAMRQEQSAFTAGQNAVEARLSEAGALINRAAQLQKDGSPYGAAVWAPRALAPARRLLASATHRLTQVIQPESRHDPQTALAELSQIQSDAEATVASLAQTVNTLEAQIIELRNLREELKQLEDQARELSVSNAGQLSQWAATQERIADLEDHWTHATSFEEARDALKAAQELARASITASRRQAG